MNDKQFELHIEMLERIRLRIINVEEEVANLRKEVVSHSRGGQHKADQSLAGNVPLTNLAVCPQAGTPAANTSQPEICPSHKEGEKCAWFNSIKCTGGPCKRIRADFRR